MSALLMGRVFYTDLPANLKLTLLAMVDHAADDGTRMYAGQKLLAQKVGCSDRTIRRAVDDLEARGYLLQEPRRGSHGTNHYRLNLAKLRSDTAMADRTDWPTGQIEQISGVDRTSTTPRPDTAVSYKPSEKQPSEKQPSALSRFREPSPEFCAFWACYPPRRGRREGKALAFAAWQKLQPDAALQAAILDAVRAYAASTELPVDAVRWLKGRRWEDEAGVSAAAVRRREDLSKIAISPTAARLNAATKEASRG